MRPNGSETRWAAGCKMYTHCSGCLGDTWPSPAGCLWLLREEARPQGCKVGLSLQGLRGAEPTQTRGVVGPFAALSPSDQTLPVEPLT